MKKKIINTIKFFILLILLSGCSEEIDQKHLKRIIESCDSNGGIYNLQTFLFHADVSIYCRDGSHRFVKKDADVI